MASCCEDKSCEIIAMRERHGRALWITRTPLAELARDAPFLVSTIFMVDTIFDADQNRFKRYSPDAYA